MAVYFVSCKTRNNRFRNERTITSVKIDNALIKGKYLFFQLHSNVVSEITHSHISRLLEEDAWNLDFIAIQKFYIYVRIREVSGIF